MFENEPQFKCPSCGNTDSFTADSVLVFNGEISITPDGWDIMRGDMDLPEQATLCCGQCGHSGHHSLFAI